MNKEIGLSLFVTGVWVGVMIMPVIGFTGHGPFGTLAEHNKLLKECEKSLPRDQQCKLVAVPE